MLNNVIDITKIYKRDTVRIFNDDVSVLYKKWPTPDMILSDGGYGVSGFKGDAKTPEGLRSWYAPHIKEWSAYARPGTTLWFWNTEIGWATVHPLLEKNGWEYVCCNTWNKGLNHIAGNCNLAKLKNFPIVTEICVQYVKKPEFSIEDTTLSLKEWLRYEWERTGLPFCKTNEACGVANAATRKYFTKCHLWYAPPADVFSKLVKFANVYGHDEGKPYFSIDGKRPLSKTEYKGLFAKFDGIYGVTNVWDHPPLHSRERIKLPNSKKYAHLNQKPLQLIRQIIETSTEKGDVLWEPFGGLCTTGLAAFLLKREAYCAEIDHRIFNIATERVKVAEHELFVKEEVEDVAIG